MSVWLVARDLPASRARPAARPVAASSNRAGPRKPRLVEIGVASVRNQRTESAVPADARPAPWYERDRESPIRAAGHPWTNRLRQCDAVSASGIDPVPPAG